MVHRMNEGYRAWEVLKSVQSNRRLGMKAKKCLYEGVIVPTSLYGAEAWTEALVNSYDVIRSKK